MRRMRRKLPGWSRELFEPRGAYPSSRPPEMMSEDVLLSAHEGIRTTRVQPVGEKHAPTLAVGADDAPSLCVRPTRLPDVWRRAESGVSFKLTTRAAQSGRRNAVFNCTNAPPSSHNAVLGTNCESHSSGCFASRRLDANDVDFVVLVAGRGVKKTERPSVAKDSMPVPVQHQKAFAGSP
mmetsp:Transcript_3871/g.11958  ORF Transcript_3871/g.11958 Transcript_3871/m.11958 type:complete len:180 (+) Transcript_3871:596-1135(+)|eukprot:scaffold280027_cov30-Tisochrysis_lutea.AAC.4